MQKKFSAQKTETIVFLSTLVLYEYDTKITSIFQFQQKLFVRIFSRNFESHSSHHKVKHRTNFSGQNRTNSYEKFIWFSYINRNLYYYNPDSCSGACRYVRVFSFSCFSSVVFSIRLFNFIPPFSSFKKCIHSWLSRHFTFASSDLHPSSHHVPCLPISLLPISLDSYPFRVNCTPIIRSTRPSQLKSFRSTQSLIFHLTPNLQASHFLIHLSNLPCHSTETP